MRRTSSRRPRRFVLTISLLAVALISVFDWITPVGIVVGLLLVLPIIVSGVGERRRDVWIVFGASLVGITSGWWLGYGPIQPEIVRVPNRILAGLGLVGGLIVALYLQTLRRRTEAAQEEVRRSSDLNRLLVPLLAHDLRAPLAMAIQMCDYVLDDSGEETDRGLISELATRLRRSLRTIDSILGLAGRSAAESAVVMTGEEIAIRLEREISAFAQEAAARNKSLRVDVRSDDPTPFTLDPLVPLQSVSILVDNAIRHASEGEIRATGSVSGHAIHVRVEDPGPEITLEEPRTGARGGVGLGLTLCRTLVSRAGGEVELVSDGRGGKAFVLRIPLTLAR